MTAGDPRLARMNGRLLAAVPLAGSIVLAAPEIALAHGLVGREDLPIPKVVFAYAATAALVASFIALAVLWPRPRLEGRDERRVASLPRILDPLCGAIGVAMLALLVYTGFAGSQTSTNNITPTFVFVIFWIGLPIASALFGDVFKAFNPWRAIARAFAAVATSVSRKELPAPMPYPAALGRWPAVAGILAFVWVELIDSARADPSHLAVLMLAYAAVQLVGMSLYGIEPWNRNGDAFAVYFGLFARISPLHWKGGAVTWRAPLSGLTTLDAPPGTVALMCAMIGSTSFDGFSAGETWGTLAPRMTDSLRDLGFAQSGALEVTFTIGLLVVVAVIAGCYRLGVRGMRDATGIEMSTDALAARFAHTLVPIALAYVVAHYFSLLAFQGQAIGYLSSDPLGSGANIFGTATATIDYSWVSATAIWYVQVAALLIGHIAGLVLAHDRALITFKDGPTATRSQYWMLVVMISFTSLGLWLLSSAS